MEVQFYKYQGAGNDFVIIDDRKGKFDADNQELIAHLCNRRFGIGADGLMLVRNKEGYDFEMVYFNADGKEGSMCGNGGRCIVAFAHYLGIFTNKCLFWAADGEHEAYRIEDKNWISLKMIPVNAIESGADYCYLNTCSPHYIVDIAENLQQLDVFTEGQKIRYNERFKKEGTNVNFTQLEGDVLHVRTYERGVEDETLACGTGVTAAVLSAHYQGKIKGNSCKVKVLGGDLQILFEENNHTYDNIWLQGPAEQVFKGEIHVG